MVPRSQMEIIHALLSVDYHVDAEMPLCECAFRAYRLCICSAEMSVVKRPFKTWIEATPATFSEKKAKGHTNWCKQAVCLCLFLSSLPLFHQWQVMRRPTPKSLVGSVGFFSILMCVYWADITQTIHILVFWLETIVLKGASGKRWRDEWALVQQFLRWKVF